MAGKRKSVAKQSDKKRRGASAEKKFADDLIIRGEAVKKKSAGEQLPPGATHWLKDDQSTERARFKLI